MADLKRLDEKMHPDTHRLQATVAHVDQLLHAGCYVELEQLSSGKRLSAELIAEAINEYPEELVQRPSYDLEDLGIVHVAGSNPPMWAVYLDLWRKDGGRSDLTVELTVVDTPSGLYRIEIDNIHVL